MDFMIKQCIDKQARIDMLNHSEKDISFEEAKSLFNRDLKILTKVY